MKSGTHHVGGGQRTDESFLSDDSLDEGERGLCDAFCPFLRSYAVVCQFRAITLVSIMDDCRRLKRTVGLELIALHCIDAIVDNSGCE